MKQILNSKILNFIMITLLILSGCKNKDGESQKNKSKEVSTEIATDIQKENSGITNFMYDLNNPEKCVLSKKLLEVSALTIDQTTDIIYTVNDEKALIYALEDCKIASTYDFGKNGDYEGIELVDNQLYVLKSSGRIIQYDLTLGDVKRVIKTPLKTKNDTEGLGFDKDMNTLLIACKGSPNIAKGSKLKKSKAIYSYDLDNDVFIDKPLFVINDDQLESYLKKQDNTQYSKKETKRRLKRALGFSPSAIAKNPVDNYYYLLSTVGKTLLILNREYEIVDLRFLDHSSFIQPEGICFNSNGEMFISNEGKGLVANILKFSMQ